MSIFVSSRQSRDFQTVVWEGETGDVLPNPNGVSAVHVTRVVSGTVSFRYDDLPRGEAGFQLAAGQQVQLDVDRGYTVSGVAGPILVECDYPRAVSGAVESIAHLLGGRRRFL